MTMLSAHDLISQRFGVRTRSAENREATTMGAGSLLVARDDSSRIALIIVNLGTDTVFIRPRGDAAPEFGFRLSANGGFMSLNIDDDFSLVTKDFNGIAPAGAPEIWVQEELIAPEAQG